MKTIIFIMMSFSTMAQLELQPNTETIYQDLQMFSVDLTVKNEDTLIQLFYVDKQYQHITVTNNIKFYSKAEFNQFFDLCLDVIENKTTYTTERYTIKRGLGQAVVYNGSSCFYISKKKIAKIKNKCLF